MFLADNMKGINSFDYIDDYKNGNKTIVDEILKDILQRRKYGIAQLLNNNIKIGI